MVWVHQRMTQPQKDKALAPFSNAQASEKRPKVLAATTSCFGIGLTFKHVLSICIIEPDFYLARMLQVESRHIQPGNVHKKVYYYLLTT